MKIWIIIINNSHWSKCLLDDEEINRGCETSSFFKDSIIKIQKQFGFRVIKLKNHERQLNLSVSIWFTVPLPLGVVTRDFTLKSSIHTHTHMINYYYAKDPMKYSGNAVANWDSVELLSNEFLLDRLHEN